MSRGLGDVYKRQTEHPLYDQVVEACRTVYDPEIPVNIYDPVSYTHLTLPTNSRV